MNLFQKKYKVNYDDLISKLKNGNKESIESLLWQPKNGRINYLPVTFEMILKLCDLDLTIHKKIENRNFELIIFKTNNANEDFPFSPIIIDKSNTKIVGIMLPFNELNEKISIKENKRIGDLGLIWTKFAIDQRFNK